MGKQHKGWPSERIGTDQAGGFKRSTENLPISRPRNNVASGNDSTAGGHMNPGAGQMGGRGYKGNMDTGNPKA